MRPTPFMIGCFAFLSIAVGQTQNPYVRQGSIGKRVTPDTAVSEGAFPFRPISEWIGQRFIFLPKSKKTQSYGYHNFGVGYDKYVGRIAKVISVDKNGNYPLVTFKLEDNGKELEATAYTETIKGIGPVADIDSARARWLHRTLWQKGSGLVLYDEEKDEFRSVKLKKYSPVQVVDIVAGWYEDTPVRFIIRSQAGDEGYVDLNLSGTNVAQILRGYSHFDDSFFIEDPRKLYPWPAEVWSAIESGKVYVGMTAEQARLSWGTPKDVNRTVSGTSIHEQWVYAKGSYLYFEEGILKTIQN